MRVENFPYFNEDFGQKRSQNQTAVAASGAGPQMDTVELSPEAMARQQADTELNPEEKLDENQQVEVAQMKRREQEVINHEMTHMAAGSGVVAGGPQYSYSTGPDGKRYIVGGEVQINMTPENTPEATIRKMEQVQHAALAPADPSPQDRAVAAAASQAAMRAREELSEKNAEEAPTGTQTGTVAAQATDAPSTTSAAKSVAFWA